MNAVSHYPIHVIEMDEPKGRVLLLEADAFRRRSIERFLCRAGYVVDSARDAADALSKIERSPALDAVLVADDELVRSIGERAPRLPIVRTRSDMDALLREVNRRAADTQRVRRRQGVLADPLTGGDHGALEAAVTRAIEGLWVRFEAVVARDGTLAYAAEVRSRDTTLPYLGALLCAAEKLGRRAEVEHRVQALMTDGAARAPRGTQVFMEASTGR